MIPFKMRALEFTAADSSVNLKDRVRGQDTEHLGAAEWTLECWVQPTETPGIGEQQYLIRRKLNCIDCTGCE